mmetsp:Transcript_30217/g.97193  ORF Transcript_30217/g.97193 Transcript_30217/m.97193 type:complete len:201 (+) Transcript_30217:212-814(+)
MTDCSWMSTRTPELACIPASIHSPQGSSTPLATSRPCSPCCTRCTLPTPSSSCTCLLGMPCRLPRRALCTRRCTCSPSGCCCPRQSRHARGKRRSRRGYCQACTSLPCTHCRDPRQGPSSRRCTCSPSRPASPQLTMTPSDKPGTGPPRARTDLRRTGSLWERSTPGLPCLPLPDTRCIALLRRRSCTCPRRMLDTWACP